MYFFSRTVCDFFECKTLRIVNDLKYVIRVTFSSLSISVLDTHRLISLTTKLNTIAIENIYYFISSKKMYLHMKNLI